MKFKLDGVGGPSAGLMFTLAIYDQVSGQDLKAGRKIAGTGTIERMVLSVISVVPTLR